MTNIPNIPRTSCFPYNNNTVRWVGMSECSWLKVTHLASMPKVSLDLMVSQCLAWCLNKLAFLFPGKYAQDF